MDRGTLAERAETLLSGEQRRYVPRPALDEAVKDRSRPVTRDDTAEISLIAQMAIREMTEQMTARDPALPGRTSPRREGLR
jgi:hypothetical protein